MTTQPTPAVKATCLSPDVPHRSRATQAMNQRRRVKGRALGRTVFLRKAQELRDVLRTLRHSEEPGRAAYTPGGVLRQERIFLQAASQVSCASEPCTPTFVASLCPVLKAGAIIGTWSRHAESQVDEVLCCAVPRSCMLTRVALCGLSTFAKSSKLCRASHSVCVRGGPKARFWRCGRVINSMVQQLRKEAR